MNIPPPRTVAAEASRHRLPPAASLRLYDEQQPPREAPGGVRRAHEVWFGPPELLHLPAPAAAANAGAPGSWCCTPSGTGRHEHATWPRHAWRWSSPRAASEDGGRSTDAADGGTSPGAASASAAARAPRKGAIVAACCAVGPATATAATGASGASTTSLQPDRPQRAARRRMRRHVRGPRRSRPAGLAAAAVQVFGDRARLVREPRASRRRQGACVLARPRPSAADCAR